MNFLTVIAGLRVEHTATTSSPFVEGDEGFVRTDFGNSYTSFMPGVHLRFNPVNNFIGRLSWTNTIGRPNYDRLSGTSEYNFQETVTPGVFTGSFEGANPDLKPYESMNLDLSLEYYFTSGGIISAGAFYKEIANQIYELDTVSNNITFQGLFFDELNFSRSINLNSAQVRGIEASYDQAMGLVSPPMQPSLILK